MTPFDPDKHGPELSAYLDGELEPQRTAEVEALLKESPEARVYLEELRAVANDLRSLPRLSAPDVLRAALRSRTAGAGGRPSARGSWFIALRTGAIAAALGVLWIAGQNMIGPVNAPLTESATRHRNEPMIAARDENKRLPTDAEKSPSAALGVPGSPDDLDSRAPSAPPRAVTREIAAAGNPPVSEPPPAAAAPSTGVDIAYKRDEKSVVGDAAGGELARDASSESIDDLPAGEVEVVINTRTPAEFSEVNGLLLSLQAPQVASNTNYMARVAEADGGELHQLEVPRAELRSLVSKLEDVAPQNVQVQRLQDADGDEAPSAAIADETKSSARALPGTRSGGGESGAGGGRAGAAPEVAKKEAERRASRPAARTPPPSEPAARRSADERAARAPRKDAPATGAAQADSETTAGLRQSQQDRSIRDAGRGGRIVYRAPSRQQAWQQRGAATQTAASQPGDAEQTLVVNVLVAPPAQQQVPPTDSQPASRPDP